MVVYEAEGLSHSQRSKDKGRGQIITRTFLSEKYELYTKGYTAMTGKGELEHTRFRYRSIISDTQVRTTGSITMYFLCRIWSTLGGIKSGWRSGDRSSAAVSITGRRRGSAFDSEFRYALSSLVPSKRIAMLAMTTQVQHKPGINKALCIEKYFGPAKGVTMKILKIRINLTIGHEHGCVIGWFGLGGAIFRKVELHLDERVHT